MSARSKTTSIRAALVDELGNLDEWFGANRAKLERRNALRSQVEGWFAAAPAGEAFKEEGVTFVLFAGPASGRSRVVKTVRRFGCAPKEAA